MLTHRGGFYLLLVLVFALTVVLVNVVESQYREQVQAEQQAISVERLSVFRHQLESEINTNLSLITGLAAFVSANPNFSEAEYARYAASVHQRQPSLINLAIAPDFVVRHVYPREGNEAVIGLDYRAQQEQWPAVERVIETGNMVVAGPVNLVQGGRAFIGRAPVYVNSSDSEPYLWGLVSAPIAVDILFEAAGLIDSLADLSVAIRGEDVTGAEGAVFYGDAVVFESPRSVVMPVSLGEVSWELAGVPALAPATTGIVAIRLIGAGFAILMMTGLWFRRRFLTERESLQSTTFENERFLRAVEQVSQVGGWRLADDTQFTEMSAQAMRIWGVSESAEAHTLDTLCAGFDVKSAALIRQQLLRALQYRSRFDREVELRRRSGEVLWLHLQGEVFEHGGRTEITGAVRDITSSKEADRLIEYQANYDSLTGLPNRNLFFDRLSTALALARRKSTRLAVVFIDLDNFKSVNDNLGHDKGDELLVEVAARIRSCVREADTVSRYSGDEFVAVLADVFSETAVSRVCADIIAEMNRPFQSGESRIYCTVSIGVSFYPDDGDEADVLIIKADQAMYEVKSGGKNSWQFYTARMQLESERKHSLYNALVAALGSNELQVYYQPVLRVSDNSVHSCEALARWRRSNGDFVPPDEFIGIAEERGLVSQVDYFVLQVALRDMESLDSDPESRMGVSVNVSPRLFYLRDEYSHDWLKLMMAASGARSVEITERMLMDDANSARSVLDRLSERGVQLAIDDFGTGYSGLSYFSRFPIQVLKIDRSFVSRIGVSVTEEALIESMLLIAEKLGLQVIAEGVETAEQAEFLVAAGCDYLQGYHVAKPMPLAKLRQFLASHRGTSRQTRISGAESR